MTQQASPGAATYPDHLRQEVEAYLSGLAFGTDEPATAGLQEAMRYSLLAGGKRIRLPLLSIYKPHLRRIRLRYRNARWRRRSSALV